MKIENNNQIQVLQLILEKENITRANLARLTQLNKSTISYIVKEYIEEDIIVEVDTKIQTGGRKGSVLAFNFDKSNVLLVDIRQEHIRYYVCNLKGDTLYTQKVNYTNILESIEEIIQYCSTNYNNINIAGVSIHGIVTDTGIISPFYTIDTDKLNKVFKDNKINCYIENEANVFATGLFAVANENIDTIVNIHIKNGVGAGIIINNDLYTGVSGCAGEVGHITVVPNGKPCGCGNFGCLETYVSESSFEKEVFDILGRKYTEHDLIYNTQVKNVVFRNVQYIMSTINTINLLINPNKIYVCSDLYADFKQLEINILETLNKDQLNLPEIEIIRPHHYLFCIGFCHIILQRKYGFSNFKLNVN